MYGGGRSVAETGVEARGIWSAAASAVGEVIGTADARGDDTPTGEAVRTGVDERAGGDAPPGVDARGARGGSSGDDGCDGGCDADCDADAARCMRGGVLRGCTGGGGGRHAAEGDAGVTGAARASAAAAPAPGCGRGRRIDAVRGEGSGRLRSSDQLFP